jgi:hypothetical protein
MQMPITTTSWHGPDDAASIDGWRKHPEPVCFLPEAIEANDQQLARVLSYLGEELSELERYVYMIWLCNRNEMLFHKVLMSQQMRFLLSSDCRRRLYEIWSHLRSFNWDAQFDVSQGPSDAAAA